MQKDYAPAAQPAPKTLPMQLVPESFTSNADVQQQLREMTAPSAAPEKSSRPRMHLGEWLGCSEIEGPAYEAMLAHFRSLAATAGGRMDVVQYGKSVEGRPLTVLRISSGKPGKAGAPAVLITQATHGNEYLKIADKIPDWLVDPKPSSGRDAFFAAGGVVYVVPIVNPDGYAVERRTNARNADLNRDFPQTDADTGKTRKQGFTQPETATLAEFLDKEIHDRQLRLALSVDYHSCSLGGALLYPWGYANEHVPKDVQKKFDHVADLLRKKVHWTAVDGRPQDVYWFRTVEGTSKDYYYAKYGTLAFTYEGLKHFEDNHLEGHEAWWDALLGWLTTDGATTTKPTLGKPTNPTASSSTRSPPSAPHP